MTANRHCDALVHYASEAACLEAERPTAAERTCVLSEYGTAAQRDYIACEARRPDAFAACVTTSARDPTAFTQCSDDYQAGTGSRTGPGGFP